jgi:hypothetical protein
MSIILQGSTSGSVTLQEPAVAGTTVLDLPAVSGNVVVDSATQTLTNKTLTSPTLTTPNINSAQFATVSGTAPIYPCRAWVNFNGTSTVAIRASGNVSSITDNGTGEYTINFTTAMPDVNYSPVFSGELMTVYGLGSAAATTTTYRMDSRVPATNALVDRASIYAAIFR